MNITPGTSNDTADKLVSPLVSAIRTASLRNSSVVSVPIAHFFCCTLCYEKIETKPRQVQSM
jgi:hypothetical protein